MPDIFSNIEFSTVIGFIAGLLTAISMLPQVIKTFKEKKADDVSWIMLIVLMAGIGLWIYYGIIKKDLPIIITNCISMAINIMMIILRFKYNHDKRMK